MKSQAKRQNDEVKGTVLPYLITGPGANTHAPLAVGKELSGCQRPQFRAPERLGRVENERLEFRKGSPPTWWTGKLDFCAYVLPVSTQQTA